MEGAHEQCGNAMEAQSAQTQEDSRSAKPTASPQARSAGLERDEEGEKHQRPKLRRGSYIAVRDGRSVAR
jgi:hypothetical protein